MRLRRCAGRRKKPLDEPDRTHVEFLNCRNSMREMDPTTLIPLAVGDAAPAVHVLPLADEREPTLDSQGRPAEHWHALLCHPQRETRAKDWLARRGVKAFFPVEQKARIVRGVRTEFQSRILPGYLFARFTAAPIWHRIFGAPYIRDAIRLCSGQPARIHPASLQSLLQLRAVAELIEERMAAAKALRAGSRARIASGPYEGHEVEIQTIGQGRARFTLMLLGGEVPAEMAVEHLRKIS